MKTVYIKNVCLASTFKNTNSYRLGTLFESIESFARKTGNPHVNNFSKEGIDGAGKVHVIWQIQTPRGIGEIRDYWWNPKEQLSICAPNRIVFLWIKGWLKAFGFRAESGNGK